MLRQIKGIAVLLASLILLTGCGKEVVTYPTIPNLTPEGMIDTETAYGYTNISVEDPKLEQELTDGAYYVLHDGEYYPLYYYGLNSRASGNTSYTDRTRQAYFSTANEIYIPTLFLQNGDKLIYYAKNNILDYITWERYYVLGYTLPIAAIRSLNNGRLVIDLTNEDEIIILPDCELQELIDLAKASEDEEFKYAMIDRISDNNIDCNILSGLEKTYDKYGREELPTSWYSDGIIDPQVLTKGAVYDLEIYNGTRYLHFTTNASMLTLRGYEMYKTIEYTPMRDYFYEVTVPDFIVNGFYNIDGLGFVRIITDTAYSDQTDYNVPVLIPPVNENEDISAYIATKVYSPYPPLNEFTTNVEGALGYIPAEGLPVIDNTGSLEDKMKQLTTATVKSFDLWLPDNRDYEIEIIPTNSEKTGSMSLVGTNTLKTATYNRLSDNYVISGKGHGEKVTLTISGFWYSYSINLTNVENYEGQDILESEVK